VRLAACGIADGPGVSDTAAIEQAA
jgi:hypothetical protein